MTPLFFLPELLVQSCLIGGTWHSRICIVLLHTVQNLLHASHFLSQLLLDLAIHL